jgi:hypothetical protein
MPPRDHPVATTPGPHFCSGAPLGGGPQRGPSRCGLVAAGPFSAFFLFPNIFDRFSAHAIRSILYPSGRSPIQDFAHACAGRRSRHFFRIRLARSHAPVADSGFCHPMIRLDPGLPVFTGQDRGELDVLGCWRAAPANLAMAHGAPHIHTCHGRELKLWALLGGEPRTLNEHVASRDGTHRRGARRRPRWLLKASRPRPRREDTDGPGRRSRLPACDGGSCSARSCHRRAASTFTDDATTSPSHR